MKRQIDENHNSKRAVLRVIGPILLGVGVIFIIVGLADFFTMNPFSGPSKFWCFFVAMPLLFVGGVCTMYGYMGAVARYQAGEIAPVGKDVVNYMAEETQDGVKTFAKAVHDGMNGIEEVGMNCPNCGEDNDEDARFCKSCGAKINQKTVCSKCSEVNDADAKYCDNCGSKLGEF